MRSAPIDPGFYRIVSLKRIITGTMSILSGIGLIVLLIVHGGRPPAAAGLALLILIGGGSWTLRDGLLMRRDLVRSRNAHPDRQQPDPDSGSDERLPGVQ